MRKCLALGLIFALLVPVVTPPRADAQLAVFDAPNWVQNVLSALRALESILQRIQMIQHQIDQIERMDINLEDLDTPFFRRLFALVSDINVQLQRAAGLFYTLSNLDEQFRDLYPHHVVSDDLERDELEQMFATLETLRGTLLATQKLAQDAGNAERVLEDLRDQALDTEGHLQVFKAQAMMLAHVGQEVSKVQQQTSLLVNALIVREAHTASREARAEATFRESLRTSYRFLAHYDASVSISIIPTTLPRLTLPE